MKPVRSQEAGTVAGAPAQRCRFVLAQLHLVTRGSHEMPSVESAPVPLSGMLAGGASKPSRAGA